MKERFLSQDRLFPFAGFLRQRYRLWAPTAADSDSGSAGPAFVFSEVDSPADIRLDYTTTLLPPKAAFLPPAEVLARIDMETHESVLPIPDAKPVALFGVHPCDLHGLARLDLAMRENPPDAPYARAREKSFIVGLACLRRCRPEAFCDSVGAYQPGDAFDIFLTAIESGYWAQIRGETAGRLVEESGLFETVSGNHRKNYESVSAAIEKTFSERRLDLASLPANLDNLYPAGYWEELAKRCFSCGACTAVCPTCVCFDVQDEMRDGCRIAERRRCWDSCLLKDFAAVAGGENFRGKRFERLRHRMMRQGRYLARRFNQPVFCVGCGRCPYVCLGKISPLEVFEFSQKGRMTRGR